MQPITDTMRALLTLAAIGLAALAVNFIFDLLLRVVPK